MFLQMVDLNKSILSYKFTLVFIFGVERREDNKKASAFSVYNMLLVEYFLLN